MASYGNRDNATENSLGKALKTIRKARGLSQEAFSKVSSRTYLSSLERGLKNPTLSKIDELCQVMEVHPLTLLALAYAGRRELDGADEVLKKAGQELRNVLNETDIV
ncbi:MAG: transcriptional regulator [Porticoccus sp.]|uniref:helix-turn-helix domain-containing protein n=1 Tax=Porticoccus sp. TaxID=2024853 RepID=UPI000C119941|nr:helix-turn-helix transcriptional regulator [Porticoccus sp.]MAZ69831.1 transcriptional regulator [Porticoccus sp.]PHS75481.1 MAG: transcriptional regulator [Porticoccus sp.]|tara:strand:+ start:20236 stop:20556 length:321 start_codon:yes stop_codon:yes gene_type:complete